MARYEDLLPLGSVVLLKGGDKRVMICGRIQACVGKNEVYDYSACPYPEGIVYPKKMLFFNHGAIGRVFFIGFQDEDELMFREQCLANLGKLYVDEAGAIQQAADR